MAQQPNRSEKDPYGLEEFSSALQEMARSVAQAVGSGINEGAQAVKKAAAPYKKQNDEEKALKKLRKRQKDAAGTALGLGITTGVFAALSLLTLASGEGAEALPMLVFMLAFGVPTLLCFIRSKRLLRVLGYCGVLRGRAYCRVDELAAATGQSTAYVRRDVTKLIRDGELEGMSLAPDGSRLFENQMAYRTYLAHCEAARRSAAAPAPRPAAPAAAPAGVLAECRTFVEQLWQEKSRITDAPVLEQVDALEKQARQVVAWLEQHPGSQQSVKRFAGYYMPTTLKLLRTYNEVDPQADDSAVASSIQTDICGILYTVNKAFRSLLDGLLQDTALDVSAEISALETVLAQDGLTGPDF